MASSDLSGEEARVVGADRVLAVLIELGEHPQGATLDELSHAMRSPKSTVHRALTSLRRAGLAAQLGRGTYALGDEFFRLAFRNVAERPDAARITPALEELSRRYGETAHYAVLDGDEVVYRAKTDPPGGAVRLTSVIGGRNPAYRTAVGRVLLSARAKSEAALAAIVGPGPFEQRTPNTVTDLGTLWADLQRVAEQGYAVDDQENEVGVNCLAVPVQLVPDGPLTGAVSVSALAFRLPVERLIEEAATIAAIVRAGGAADPQR